MTTQLERLTAGVDTLTELTESIAEQLVETLEDIEDLQDQIELLESGSDNTTEIAALADKIEATIASVQTKLNPPVDPPAV